MTNPWKTLLVEKEGERYVKREINTGRERESSRHCRRKIAKSRHIKIKYTVNIDGSVLSGDGTTTDDSRKRKNTHPHSA